MKLTLILYYPIHFGSISFIFSSIPLAKYHFLTSTNNLKAWIKTKVVNRSDRLCSCTAMLKDSKLSMILASSQKLIQPSLQFARSQELIQPSLQFATVGITAAGWYYKFSKLNCTNTPWVFKVRGKKISLCFKT